MEVCPACGRPLVPFRGKLVCRTPGCGFMESCCDGGWMDRGENLAGGGAGPARRWASCELARFTRENEVKR